MGGCIRAKVDTKCPDIFMTFFFSFRAFSTKVPGETLFPIEDAIKRGTIIMNLLSDAAQSATWPRLAPLITKGKTLYFSHGFSVVYKEDTKVVPPKDVDVILVAPKGSGRTVRTLFKEGRGINSSIAVWQDVSGKAKERATALGVAIGSGYMYETTFEKEVYSDLYGERGVVRLQLDSLVIDQLLNLLSFSLSSNSLPQVNGRYS